MLLRTLIPQKFGVTVTIVLWNSRELFGVFNTFRRLVVLRMRMVTALVGFHVLQILRNSEVISRVHK